MIQYKNQFIVTTSVFDLTAKLYNIYTGICHVRYLLQPSQCQQSNSQIYRKIIIINLLYLFSINIGNVLIECNQLDRISQNNIKQNESETVIYSCVVGEHILTLR